MVEHTVYVLLALWISFNDDITLPQCIPGLPVTVYQFISSLQLGEYGESFSLIERIVMMRRSDRGTDDGITICFTGSYLS